MGRTSAFLIVALAFGTLSFFEREKSARACSRPPPADHFTFGSVIPSDGHAQVPSQASFLLAIRGWTSWGEGWLEDVSPDVTVSDAAGQPVKGTLALRHRHYYVPTNLNSSLFVWTPEKAFSSNIDHTLTFTIQNSEPKHDAGPTGDKSRMVTFHTVSQAPALVLNGSVQVDFEGKEIATSDGGWPGPGDCEFGSPQPSGKRIFTSRVAVPAVEGGWSPVEYEIEVVGTHEATGAQWGRTVLYTKGAEIRHANLVLRDDQIPSWFAPCFTVTVTDQANQKQSSSVCIPGFDPETKFVDGGIQVPTADGGVDGPKPTADGGVDGPVSHAEVASRGCQMSSFRGETNAWCLFLALAGAFGVLRRRTRRTGS